MNLWDWITDRTKGWGGVRRTRGQGTRILMVDDEESFLRMTRRNLEAEGFVVETVSRARQALAAARAFRPDLVLLDVMMPDGDGGEIASRLGADPDLAGVPVIFLTAAVKGSEIGARGTATIGGRLYVAKPVQIDDLVRYIGERVPCPA